MIAELKKNTEVKMKKTLEALKNDLGKVRTGRAHTGLLDHVTVDYYGAQTPLSGVANVTLIDPELVWTVGEDGYESRSYNSCFGGRELTGRVLMTVAAGRVAFRQRSFALGVAS